MNVLELFNACRNGNLDVIRQHVNRNNVNKITKDGKTLLFTVCATTHYPSDGKHLECVKYLVEQSADLKVRYFVDDTFEGERIAKVLCYYGNYQTLEYILEQGVDPNELNSDEESTLIYLTDGGYDRDGRELECTKVLLKYGADVHLRDYKGYTALINASWSACKEAIQMLIDAGSDVNAMCEEGFTPLGRSFYNRREGCTEVLLNNGAIDYTECLNVFLTKHSDSIQMTYEVRETIKALISGWNRKKSAMSV